MPAMSSWHRFTPSSADDHDCAHPRCALIVADEALELIAIDCPAPACTDTTNDGPCVMVLTETSVACAYCGARGSLEDDEVDPLWADDQTEP